MNYELTTVPTFNFKEADGGVIKVGFYNESIQLDQGKGKQVEIGYEDVSKLFEAIKKCTGEALSHLNSKG